MTVSAVTLDDLGPVKFKFGNSWNLNRVLLWNDFTGLRVDQILDNVHVLLGAEGPVTQTHSGGFQVGMAGFASPGLTLRRMRLDKTKRSSAS